MIRTILLLPMILILLAQPASADMTQRDADIEEAFERSIRAMLPLSPDHIREAKERTLENEKASRIAAPKALIAPSKLLSMKPGAPVQTITLYPNFPTIVKITDVTGAPWPIKEASSGNSNWLEVVKSEVETGNILILKPNVNEGSCGLPVTLAPNFPITFGINISATGGKAETLINFHVDRSGPLAKPPVLANSHKSSASKEILAFLDGLAPDDAKLLRTSNEQIEVWEFNQSYFIRSPWPITWPDFYSSARSASMYVYQVPPIPSFLAAPDEATEYRVTIYDNLDEE